MPVRLDQVAPPAPRPTRPRPWFWLGLLGLLLLLGIGKAWLFSEPMMPPQSMEFWKAALGLPLLGGGLLFFCRAIFYFAQQGAAEGWDEAREADRVRRMGWGRRSQQVLSVSLHTALPEPLAAVQLAALKNQPSRLDGLVSRHSRLPDEGDEDPKQVLLGALTKVLGDLARTLSQLPEDKPLAILLETDSGLPEHRLRRVWQHAWAQSGIRQSTTPVEFSGLAAVDHWLDQRIADQALLLVVAVQFAPVDHGGTAEAVVGLLLGNRLTQTVLSPLAYLHRPEPEREATPEHLRDSIRQALDWVPLQAPSIERIWRVGIDPDRDAAVVTELQAELCVRKDAEGLCNLDALLGHPGPTSPWLAFAAATQSIQVGAGPQFVISGDSAAQAGLWTTVLTPAHPLSE